MIKREFASYEIDKVGPRHQTAWRIMRRTDAGNKVIGEVWRWVHDNNKFYGKFSNRFGGGYDWLGGKSFLFCVREIIRYSEEELEQQWKALQQAMESEDKFND